MIRFQKITTGVAFLCLAAMVSALAACGSDTTPSQTQAPNITPPSPMPLIVTRIVTPRPTFTPPPTATLAYDLAPVAGRWILRFSIIITDSALADELRYTAAADLTVGLDGTVTGSGWFTPNISDSPCLAQVSDDTPLSFTLQGTTRPHADAIWADVRILPDDPYRAELYTIICPDYDDVRTHSGAILWPALIALDRLEWSFTLESNQNFAFTADLSQDATTPISGLLDASVGLERN